MIGIQIRWRQSLGRYTALGRLAVAAALGQCLAAHAVIAQSQSRLQQGEGASVRCVVLERPDFENPRAIRKVLARELFRQAFLVAAREEFALATRDAVLREDVTEAEGTRFRLELNSVGPGLTLVASVHGSGGKTAKELWASEKVSVDKAYPLHYGELVVSAERLSRSGFCDVLKDAGFQPVPPRSSKQKIPATVERQLGELNLVDQYAAVRALHAQLQAHGQSPELLGGLARGYTHLSVLTQAHWNVSHKVFLARAQLYAQRMLSSYPEAPSSRAHLAYALALGGLHEAALQECGALRGGAPGSDVSPMVDFVEAICTFDNAKLDALVPSGVPVQLGRLVQLLSCEFEALSPHECQLAGALLERHPFCLRVLSPLSRVGPIGYQHLATETAVLMVDDLVRHKVAALPDLPKEVSTIVKSLKAPDDEDEAGAEDWRVGRVAVYQGLLKAGSPARKQGEPSWTLLGRFIEEELYLAAVERAWFIRETLSVDPSDEVEFYLGFVPEHPCRPFLEVCGIQYGEGSRRIGALMKKMVVPDLDVQMHRVLPYLEQGELQRQAGSARPTSQKSSPGGLHARFSACLDHTARDLLLDMNRGQGAYSLAIARLLLSISPQHPAAAGRIVVNDWESMKAKLPEWESRFGRHKWFIREIARQYQELGPSELAQAYLKKLIELSPEVEYYWELAEEYRKAENLEGYVSTLQEALKLPEVGLEHARIRRELAEYHMERGEYKAALPLAREAAESGAGDCLQSLSRCYEGLGDLKEAEKWARECSEHYRSKGYHWFFWCKRTGFGDIESARKLAGECLVARDTSDPEVAQVYGVYLLLNNEPAQAMEAFEADFKSTWNPVSGLHCALLALKMGDRGRCDEFLKALIANSGKDQQRLERRAPLIELARVLQPAMAAGTAPGADAVKEVGARATAGQLVYLNYFAGRFCEALGEEARGRDYLLRAARAREANLLVHVLAIERCRQLRLTINTGPASN